MKLTFLGATGTVTGSKYMVEDGARRILVDCGLFQGRKDLRLRNWAKLPVNPSSIDAVILTHAHLDHSGYLPLLVRDGFKGNILCSEGTSDLCRILLPDSGHIQEEDAEHANRHGYSKHHPALPLYTEQDALKSLEKFKSVPFAKPYIIDGDTYFTLHRAGHILGASFVRLVSDGGTSILFSGDMGRMNNPIMKPPTPMEGADYLVIESTYGDRLHSNSDCSEDIGRIVNETISHGGTVLIPAFAVGRAQEIMYYLYQLKIKGQLPANLPIYLDSPMAINASELLGKHMNDHRLSAQLCADVCNIAKYIHTPEESKSLDANLAVPKVIISASGMATGGRILHHLKHYAGDRRNTILLTGFQAEGTRGAQLEHGAKELKFHGRMYPINARVEKIDGMSAHADYSEMLSWLRHFTRPPKKVFITHGEPAAAQSLKLKIEEAFGWNVFIPEYLYAEEV